MDKIQRMKKWMAIVVVVALALNGLLSATAYATGGPDLFRVRNSNGPGGDHGYMKVTYNGNTVNLDRGEETTFIYVPGAGNVSIDFVPDTNWAFDYYVIGNGATHINTDPTLINPSSYAGRPGDNNRISVNPKWEAIHSYTVTWKNYNNTQLEQDTNVPSGTTPTYNGATPTRPATAEFTYTFSGWSPAVAAVTGDITYTAQFTATKNAYDVTWKNYNNTQLEKDEDVLYGTTPTYNGATPTRPATAEFTYTFSGWSPAVSAVTGDITYTAQFTAVTNAYDVTWNNFDNSELEKDEDVPYGAAPTYDSATPTKPATAEFTYTFSGWSPAVSAVTGDITYTAQFTAVTNAYNVTWNNYDNSELEKDEDVLYGATPTYNGATPIKPATAEFTYTFSGWSPAVSVVTGDITYTAQFTAVTNAYDVRFVDYNGTVLKTESVLYGNSATAPANPNNQTGYHFTGWDVSFNPVTGNLTVTAQYAINTYIVRFFRADGVTQIGAAQTINWGTAAVLENAPARTGFAFAGWSLTGDDAAVATSLLNVRENIDAVAGYNPLVFVVRFEDFDGTLLGTDEVQYGDDATAPGAPTREGYDFTGWSPSYDTVTGNMTVVAEYTIQTFTVTFVNFDGTVIDTQTVDWNTGATAPEVPQRDGFEFTGWDRAFDPVTSDITVTAQFGEIAAPAPEPTVIPDDEPVPTTGGGVSPLWWLLLIPGLGLLIWLLLAWLSIVPIAEAVSDNGDGTMTIQWGYENRKGRTKKIDEEDSQLTALAGSVIRNSQEPPFEFEKGRVENVFTTVAAVGSKIQWKIKNRKANVDLSKANK